jgi:hypothetical protein
VGLRSRLKKALGGVVQSLPGHDKIQKVIGKDPIAQMVMKVDPLARDIGDVHGLRPGAAPTAAAAVDAAPVDGRKGFQPPVRNTSWQSDRVAGLRAKFGRPGSAPTMPAPVSATPPATTAMPTVPQAAPAVPSIKTTMPVNQAAQDLDAYSQSWEQANNRY